MSGLAFHSNGPSSNPAKVNNFPVRLLLKRTKINKMAIFNVFSLKLATLLNTQFSNVVSRYSLLKFVANCRGQCMSHLLHLLTFLHSN